MSKSPLLLVLQSCLPPGLFWLRAFRLLPVAVVGMLSLVLSRGAEPARPKLLQDDFPFQTACIGAKFPAKNIAYKGVALRLGHDAYMCFDTDLLRMSAGWTGGYITTKGVAFDGAHGGNPQLAGPQNFGTAPLPGWADANGNFADTRSEPFGPIPSTQGRWDGLYVTGEQVVLSYTVLGTKILERPGSLSVNGLTGFVRTFQTKRNPQALSTVLCEVPGATGAMQGSIAILNGPSNTVTMAALVAAPKNATLQIASDGRLLLHLPRRTSAATFDVVIWNGSSADQGKFAALLAHQPTKIDLKYGAAHWPAEVVTKGVLGTGDGAYVADTLTAPVNNPWNRRVRFGGLDFFKDGKRAALCTWDGDVWIVSGIDEKLENLRWRRFASGGYETLGLKIVDDVIYTSGRDQITRYHDLNKDGEADFYENFNNQIASSQGFHEFVFDLQTDSKGNFYMAKAGPVRSGGRSFGGGGGNGEITSHAGTILKVSKDGKTLAVFATGFRAPNGLGVGPDGQITAGDNEGTWMPTSPIHWVTQGSFHGVETLAHRSPIPEFSKPLTWMSHNGWDNSGGGQVWVNSRKWGPFEGELLHTSYGTASLFLVLRQQVGTQMQGGVVKLPVSFTSSAMRPRFNPRDGQLYVAGLQGWQTKAAKITGLDRIRYTGKPVNSVRDLKVSSSGITLTFTDPLDATDAADTQNYSVQRWNYQRTSDYGSPEFSLLDPKKRAHDTVEVTQAVVSADGKSVTLRLTDLRTVDQMQISLAIKTRDGAQIKQQIQHTIHAVP